MCGRFVMTAPGRITAEHFLLAEDPGPGPRYNIAPSQPVAAVRVSVETGNRELVSLKWGLLPFWAKDPKIAYRLINARAETVAAKPAFRAAFKKRRCLIPACGFYEWRRIKKKKQPFLFQVKGAAVFAFAGLWEHWEGPTGDVVESCTIITTEPNELVGKIHDRMPVILPPEHYKDWLDGSLIEPSRLGSLLVPFDARRMKAFPVSPLVNTPANDVEECVNPIGPELWLE